MIPCETLSPEPSMEEAHGMHWLPGRIWAPDVLGDLWVDLHLLFCLVGFQFLSWVGLGEQTGTS